MAKKELEKCAADIEEARRYVAQRTPSVEDGGRILLDAGRRTMEFIRRT